MCLLPWRVQEEQRALLKFVTSCSRAPLGGFRHLNPPFTIHRVRLPVQGPHCFALLLFCAVPRNPGQLALTACPPTACLPPAEPVRRAGSHPHALGPRLPSHPAHIPLQVDCSASLLAAVGGKDVDRLPTASTCRWAQGC